MASSAATCHRRRGPKYALADQNTTFGQGSFPNDYSDGLDDYLSHRLVLVEETHYIYRIYFTHIYCEL